MRDMTATRLQPATIDRLRRLRDAQAAVIRTIRPLGRRHYQLGGPRDEA